MMASKLILTRGVMYQVCSRGGREHNPPRKEMRGQSTEGGGCGASLGGCKVNPKGCIANLTRRGEA
jgi:hypothetical protein